MENRRFAILPFNSTIIKDRYLVSNFLGGWDFLTKEEFKELNSLKVKENTPLFKRLYEKGLIVDENNLKNLINEYRNLNGHLFSDTSLHIAVVTTACNLSCRYCQTRSFKKENMNYEVATRVLKFIFDVRNPYVTLEFQGGEPLLNWEIVSFLVENAKKFQRKEVNLRIALVSNLTLLTEEKMEFLKKFNVEICTSLDGPKFLHDKNRIFKNGKGSYDIVAKKIEKIRKKFKMKVHLLPTITKHSLKYYKEIIDEYVRWGQEEISLRPVNRLGVACRNWLNLGYTAEEFGEFYKKSLDYILELNKKGIYIKERIARVILEKVFNKMDAGYVDLMNPCGAGRNVITYMPDGSCFPCDEARMVDEDTFKLGNILKENYEDIIKKERLLYLLYTSVVNMWDYNSAFLPWIGTCPVLNYYTQRNFVPKIWCSFIYKIYNYQFRCIFEKILEDEENVKIFKSWIRRR